MNSTKYLVGSKAEVYLFGPIQQKNKSVRPTPISAGAGFISKIHRKIFLRSSPFRMAAGKSRAAIPPNTDLCLGRFKFVYWPRSPCQDFRKRIHGDQTSRLPFFYSSDFECWPYCRGLAPNGFSSSSYAYQWNYGRNGRTAGAPRQGYAR